MSKSPAPLTVEQQILLSQTLDLFAGLGLLMRQAGSGPLVYGKAHGMDAIVDLLKPALEICGGVPDRPEDGDDETFLQRIRDTLVTRLQAEERQPHFVPAAMWTSDGRLHIFEHMRLDLDDVIAGVNASEFVDGLVGVDGGHRLRRLVRAGQFINLRSISLFLTAKKVSRDYEHHEVVAAQFFPAGVWSRVLGHERREGLNQWVQQTHGTTAHLTNKRPRVDRLEAYDADPTWWLGQVLAALKLFAENVAPPLVPDWFDDWATTAGRNLFSADYFGPAPES